MVVVSALRADVEPQARRYTNKGIPQASWQIRAWVAASGERSMGKNALITGATAGIGFEFAELLASKGHALALVARDQARLAEQAASLEARHKIQVITLGKDLSNPASAPDIFRELQRRNFPVSVLINNAGCGVYGLFAETDLARELEMLQVNMASLAQLTKLFLKPMLDRHEGRILNVASTASFQPGPRLSLYSASKAFVFSFSCALALELRGTGVTVTTLCPGGTRTEFQRRAGMKPSPALRPMTARSVAEIGYAAMLKGRPVVVAGWKNKLMVAVSRRAPAMWSARVAEKLNKGR
jgi:short-subunit dehydrogenase